MLLSIQESNLTYSAVLITSVFGFGLINKFHCSFEVVLQERVMRNQILRKFKKQWDDEGNSISKKRIMNDWFEIKSYVPEEYDMYISYSDKRKIHGASGKKISKIKK